ncbi:DUF4132 domain-containing protein [Paenibacillus sp. FJAT-27812]|uniref:DUF4132 domain-containing protein n=1 Tax=Paenibacillus sp. FJAT-27812 TaxID=1684143 RepID=UPI0006A76EDD|nr:DUF4132 domain-containing protein [Paenibacillus sp. FJAT-27812]
MERGEQKLYFQNMKDKVDELTLSDSHKRLAGLLVQISERGYNDYEISGQIKEQLLVLASGEEQQLFEPLAEIIAELLDDSYAHVFRYMATYATEYPYSTGYARRPFRTREQRLHLDRLLAKMISLFYLNGRQFSVIEYLTKANYIAENDYQFPKTAIADIIAYGIDDNNEAVMTALKDIIYGDNNTALLSRSMISGIFLSHSLEAYRMLGELLVAARLQEGLRQSIVEAMDEGTIEAMQYMLEVVIEHDLIRYSSVIRALDVWTGLGLEAANSRVAKKNLEFAARCLADASACEEGLASSNVNELYMSLWAIAVREEQQLYDKIRFLMTSKDDYRKIVAQYMLAQSQNEDVRFAIAKDWLGETNKELQYWLVSNYSLDYSYKWERADGENKSRLELKQSSYLSDKEARRQQYEQFKLMLSAMPAKEITAKSQVFDWIGYTYSSDMIVRKLLFLTAHDMDIDWIAELVAMKDALGPDQRGELLKYFMNDVSNSVQRSFLIASLSDKSMSNRELAILKAANLELSEDEIDAVTALLKLKTGSLRQGAIGLLLKQPARQLEAALALLLQSRNELQRLAALELLTEMKDEPAHAELSNALQDEVDSIAEPTDKERLLIAKLKQQDSYTLSNGLGLFDPAAVDAELTSREQLPFSALQEARSRFDLTTEQIRDFVTGLADLVHLHREHEYEMLDYSGARQSLLIGARLTELSWSYDSEDTTPALERYPLSQVWADYLEESGFGAAELLQLDFYRTQKTLCGYYYGELEHWRSSSYEPAEGWRKELLEQLYQVETLREAFGLFENLPYGQQVNKLIGAYVEQCDKQEQFEPANHVLNLIIQCFPAERVAQESQLLDLYTSFWGRWVRANVHDDESFIACFRTYYHLYEMNGYDNHLLTLSDFARAYSLGVIDEHELLRELIARPQSSNHIRQLTNPQSKLLEQYPQLIEFKEKVVLRILEIELNRGDLATEVTNLATSIQHIDGMEHFLAILAGLDKESFVRGYIYGYGRDVTKKETFSHLLKVCHPRKDEDEALMAELLKGRSIAETRLLEAAMYAPQWVELVSRHLGWSGLRSAAWYFHAHINESFSAEKETIVAQYSPISPQDFNDGAFDIDWFRQAYEELGEEKFQLLYQCAKYISAGSNHRRSQLFADAVLGKLKLAELYASASEKRNKDHLLSYSLLPFGEGGSQTRDVLGRYTFIQQFLKESKTFGAQRRASEAKTASIALDNLARNAGYADVIRLTWDMEGRKLDELLHYFEPHALDDILTAQLVIDGDGKTDIRVLKHGKELKSVPAAYKKNEYITVLKETKAELTEQYRRARAELERSMEAGSGFTLQEVSKLARNPVLSPLVGVLVFKSGESLGFFDAETGTLNSPQGDRYEVKDGEQLVIAHPLHFFESGQWSSYQKDLFDRQVKQPFKQIFRELYVPNGDELASGSLSRRYAGHQVQPRKTVSLLKGRRWTVSYEEGLQKVFYKENVIASIYALADWFSPSDIESPTLETVRFFDRHTLKGLDIAQVPSLIFSEVMRDVDLVVSVAHVGGVDPEASLTTIGIRTAIVRESLRLLKIDNVRLEGNHALIAGKLGEYSVHLGSGMVHKQAKGALSIVPVHSQHRGRLFLPFMDEDPKTAEILSKIVLLAQDAKLKDPQILAQLQA